MLAVSLPLCWNAASGPPIDTVPAALPRHHAANSRRMRFHLESDTKRQRVYPFIRLLRNTWSEAFCNSATESFFMAWLVNRYGKTHPTKKP